MTNTPEMPLNDLGISKTIEEMKDTEIIDLLNGPDSEEKKMGKRQSRQSY